MKILVVGSGSIGLLFGGLCSITEEVYLVGRKYHISTINRNGLYISSRNGELHLFPRAATTIPKHQKFDLVMITTKAFDLENTLLELINKGFTDVPILILQNGYGNEKIVRKMIAGAPIIRGITTEGSYVTEPGKIVRVGIGRTFVGLSKESPMNSDLPEKISKIFSSNGLPSTSTDDIESWIWGKLLVNAVINPICAIVECHNGYILENQYLTELMEKLTTELASLTKILDFYLPYEDLFAEVKRVIEETSQNRCSMLQDLLKKQRTEIDFINGAISLLAKEKNRSATINDTLTALIRGKEEKILREKESEVA